MLEYTDVLIPVCTVVLLCVVCTNVICVAIIFNALVGVMQGAHTHILGINPLNGFVWFAQRMTRLNVMHLVKYIQLGPYQVENEQRFWRALINNILYYICTYYWRVSHNDNNNIKGPLLRIIFCCVCTIILPHPYVYTHQFMAYLATTVQCYHRFEGLRYLMTQLIYIEQQNTKTSTGLSNSSLFNSIFTGKQK